MSESEREELSAFLVAQANEYSTDIETGIVEPRALQYPEHTHRPIDWDTETLENYGEFVGLAVDEHWLEYSEDGTEIADEEIERVYEYRGDER